MVTGREGGADSAVLARWFTNPQLRVRVAAAGGAGGGGGGGGSAGQRRVTACFVMRDGGGGGSGVFSSSAAAVAAAAAAAPPGGPVLAAFHVVQNEPAFMFSPSACVAPNPDLHRVVAASAGGYVATVGGGHHNGHHHHHHHHNSSSNGNNNHNDGSRVAICELQRVTQRVLRDAAAAGVGGNQEEEEEEIMAEFPYFVVPSTSKAGQTGQFAVEIMATAPLLVEEVTEAERASLQ